MTETYEDVAKLLRHTAQRFSKSYGLDHEESFSQANLLFMSAYDSYDPRMSAFTTWLVNVVWNGLKNHYRKNTAEDQGRYRYRRNTARSRTTTFDVEKLEREVSEDASFVIILVIDPPIDIRLATKTTKFGKIRTDSLTKAIMEYLRDIGWSSDRIQNSFTEIQESLSAD